MTRAERSARGASCLGAGAAVPLAIACASASSSRTTSAALAYRSAGSFFRHLATMRVERGRKDRVQLAERRRVRVMMRAAVDEAVFPWNGLAPLTSS